MKTEIEELLDAANARIAELEELLTAERGEVSHWQGEHDQVFCEKVGLEQESLQYVSQINAANARAETAEQRTRIELARADAAERKLYRIAELTQERDHWESEAAALRAEVERLTARLTEQVESGDGWRAGQATAENRCHVLSTSLAEARRLLVRLGRLGLVEAQAWLKANPGP